MSSEKRKSVCNANDVVELRAWWKAESLMECKVIDTWYSERTNEQFVTVQPTAGNPHYRFVNQSRITKVNGIPVANGATT